MFNRLKMIIPLVFLLVCSATVHGQEISREQIKGLDEQVQEIKAEVLTIAAELNQLEEKLLYPSNTQIALFVSLGHGETFRLDSVEVQLAGRPVAHHIYTFKELEALQKGGVQRIYTGNVRTGGHELQVAVLGKSSGGGEIRQTERFQVVKGIGPKIVEISLTDHNIVMKDR